MGVDEFFPLALWWGGEDGRASSKLKTSFNSRRMSFWNNYYPKLEQVKFDVNKEVVSGAKDVVTMGTALQVVFALIVYLIY